MSFSLREKKQLLDNLLTEIGCYSEILSITAMEKLLTIDQLCSLINLKKATVYDFVYRKRIPYVKIGRLLRFREDLIEEWLQQKTYIPFEIVKKRER